MKENKALPQNIKDLESSINNAYSQIEKINESFMYFDKEMSDSYKYELLQYCGIKEKININNLNFNRLINEINWVFRLVKVYEINYDTLIQLLSLIVKVHVKTKCHCNIDELLGMFKDYVDSYKAFAKYKGEDVTEFNKDISDFEEYALNNYEKFCVKNDIILNRKAIKIYGEANAVFANKIKVFEKYKLLPNVKNDDKPLYCEIINKMLRVILNKNYTDSTSDMAFRILSKLYAKGLKINNIAIEKYIYISFIA